MGRCGKPQSAVDPELFEAFADDPDLLAVVLNLQEAIRGAELGAEASWLTDSVVDDSTTPGSVA